MSSPYLCVYASQAAACIGENRYKKIAEAVETFWSRADAESYRKAMHRNDLLTNDEIVEKVEKSHPTVATLLSIASREEHTSTEVSEKYAKLSSDFEKYAGDHRFSGEVAAMVDDALRKSAYTSYGNVAESEVFRYIRDVLKVDIVEDSTFYNKPLGEVETPYGSFKYFIGGKIDGITRDGKTLVEIKNRVNRLFGRPPVYENIQIQTYLHLLDIDKAFLVECLKSKNGNSVSENVNCISINRDRAYFEMEVIPRIEGFVNLIVHLIYDQSLQDKFVTSKRRNAIATHWINKHVDAKRRSRYAIK
ncbi:hypothetical protein ATCVBr0604L_064R [Acanthocystis turfacea Chlorella virus Br0604L]|nr:hypothetical protein ATCVBr0604L_064R [Acanthocystis turfacea Chlorella virus Br0604L]AGE59636.1 hypothetical protein ATCVTN60342_065R [Acanthocystis turfacea Chlorella virus TN603.4.2]